MATPYQIRQLQRGERHICAPHPEGYGLGPKGQPKIDGQYGPVTHRYSEVIQHNVLGIPPSKVGHYPIQQLIGGKVRLPSGKWVDYGAGWFFKPDDYWHTGHPQTDADRLKRHRDGLAYLRRHIDILTGKQYADDNGKQDIHNFAAIAHSFGLLCLDFGPGLGRKYADGDSIVYAVHVRNSMHYSGHAFDGAGTQEAMSAFVAYMVKNYPNTSQLLWCGPGAHNSIDGEPTSCGGGTGDHTDHVHVGQW